MAATSTDLPFVLSISIFFFVSFSRFPPAASSAEVPLSVSAKADAVRYWNRVAGSNGPPPPALALLSSNGPPPPALALLSSTRPPPPAPALLSSTRPPPPGLALLSSNGPPPPVLSHLSSNGPPPPALAHISNTVGDYKSSDGIRMVTGEDAEKKADDNRADAAYWAFYDRGSGDNHANADSPDTSSASTHNPAAGGDHDSEDDLWVFYGRGSGDDRASPLDPPSRSGRNRADKQTGNFFRESQLKEGAAMRMPTADHGREVRHLDFLPRHVASRIPMSADAVRRIFHIPAGAPMGKAVAKTIDGCKRAAPEGETRRCVTSAEDMIDYVVSSLGAKRGITARSTRNSDRLGGDALIGEVKAANGGELGRVVVCHQARFPYLMYHCHSVPKTKLYEVEMLDPETKEEVGLAAAICHFDTSVWSPSHVAFMALGYERGMEVCHWIHPSAMAWTAAAE